MREEPLQSGTDRWEWYARGDASFPRPIARRTLSASDDNSADQVLWESGLAILVPLLGAALFEIVLRVFGT